ncbi:DNA-binding transcriptional LysR family regulator [Sphingomonas sp. BE270]|jgi:DNA-binding transcriptional LysR family regulator|uniref:LysR family transcriptional regulator n=1 Tax=Sphingomonas sp. BE270 TaxID=2817726 RepID=UPI0028555DBE|nr:LysR family transcriptional regulator [Sphingomonas sp. BE270]MCA3774506.1 LysR family transcriptional regulator [Cutibacterium sp.]MDR7260320.1 DNA-binding transcriptional LysR family regulator [Sphingomonas sp. BE270]
MQIEDLRSFAQVVRFGGFTAAARETGQTKARLSKRVARLEHDLGARLIERSTRSFRVTDVGTEVYQQCQTIVESIEATEAIASRLRTDVSGTLHVSCPPGLAHYLGSEVIADFLIRYPLVRVRMHLTTRRVNLINERFDIALRIALESETDQSLTMRQLGRARRILVASPTFLELMPIHNVESLNAVPILGSGEHLEHERWELIRDDGQTHNAVYRPRLCSNDSGVIREAAVNGLGIALVAERGCIAELAAGSLIHILPQWHASENDIHMVFSSKKGMLPALRAFIDHYVARFPNFEQIAQ